MAKLIIRNVLVVFGICVILFIGYIIVNLIVFNGIVVPFVKIDNDDEIVKKALSPREINDEKYIIGEWVAITGYNYRLSKDENGKRTKKLCRVTGATPESEITYDFLTTGNSFIMYVIEIKQYYDPNFSEEITEYVVDGWDVLYPAKHDSPITTIPRYILESDYRK